MSDWETTKHRFAEIARDVVPVQPGEVGVWYDNAGGYCDVIWGGGFAFFAGTEHENVKALTDNAGNLHGFKIDAVERMGNGGDYTIVNLRNGPGPADVGGPRKVVIQARYHHDSHSFDVVWSDGECRYVATENSHILASVNQVGTLCGFRVIHTDLLSNDEHGMAHARLKTRLPVTAG